MSIIDKVFGSYSERELKRVYPVADKIMKLDEEYGKMSDEELKRKTVELKERLANGETLDDILVEAFATAREAAWRVLGMKPFRVQLIGGIVLHQGRIAEMKTGEGKTLVAVLPVYLNALAGNGVHVVTVNDYLAKRDSEWMGKIYTYLGLSVGLIARDMTPDARKAAYAADITYGTNNELGFDYLRDNMATNKANTVQRGHSFAIVDEVDSILIDEARTPLIISGPGEKSTDLYEKADKFAKKLTKIAFKSADEKSNNDDLDADYYVEEKEKTAVLTERGIKKAEKEFNVENIADIENTTLYHHILQAIRANGIMKRDIDYVVKDGEIVIVDEFTGRLMFGRRYNEGLHQAIEAKEGVPIKNESKTYASITFQNYFRLYDKLAGMTGTAMTEEEEFRTIYKMDVVEVPTNKPVIRIDDDDIIYKNDNGKKNAVIDQVIECYKKGQPVLVGTISIEKSEMYSRLLKAHKIPHNVLNAKNHEKEAEIIAQAGKFGAVTIATNMAGRGTDITLGGNPEYLAKQEVRKAGYPDEVIAEADGHGETDNEQIIEARKLYNEKYKAFKVKTDEEAEKVRSVGGLFVIGTERHESRRIDNQLRGRSGRQGDPGESVFFVALTDDIMRLFGSERIMSLVEAVGLEDDVPVDNKFITNAISNAQKAIEGGNFEIRKHVLEYDNVLNKQRGIIYEERQKVLNGDDIHENIEKMITEYIENTISSGMQEDEKVTTQERLDEILAPFNNVFLSKGTLKIDSFNDKCADKELLVNVIVEIEKKFYEIKEKTFGNVNGIPLMREIERVILLRVVDTYWMNHIDNMEELKRGMSLRTYANVNPVQMYTMEGFEMFDEMVNDIKTETATRMLTVQVKVQTIQK